MAFKKAGGWGGRSPPPICNPLICKRTACLMTKNKGHNNYVFDAILVDGATFLNTSLHGVKKKSGGVGGAQPPPFANTFITGSEKVPMGSVFAGAKIPEVSCMVLKNAGGWGGQPPPLQTPLSRVLRGSICVVFFARMIAAAILHSLKIARE